MPVETMEYLAQQVTRRLYEQVVRSSSPLTASAVSRLLTHARALHRALEIEHLAPGVELVLSIGAPYRESSGVAVNDLRSLVALMPADRAGVSILLMPNDSYRIEYRAVDDSPVENAVKYVILPFSREVVVTPNESHEIDRLSGMPSPFALPYFRELETALQDYYTYKARDSSCPHLSLAWADENRIALSNKPEKHMRRSLHDFLSTRLRDAEPVVLQEQTVNETEPVDIRVQWLDSRRISLIEVKWLGDSVSADGASMSTPYRDARAKEGYQQALDYMSQQRATLPDHILRSRLVVFDARRAGVRLTDPGTFECSDPWAFLASEVDYEAVRTDDPGMEEPIRYFLHPVQVAA